MIEFINNSFRLRLLIGSLIIITSLFLLPQVVSALWTENSAIVLAESPNKSADNENETPNVVASGMNSMTHNFGRGIDTAEQKLSRISTIPEAISNSGESISNAAQTGTTSVIGGIQKGFGFIGNTIGGAFVFAIQAPGKIFGLATNIPSPMTFIRPSDDIEIPVIDEQLAALYAGIPAVPVTEAEKIDDDHVGLHTYWPIHGNITTRFGVPHRPYQVRHTGLDISSGSRSGATGIKPFRAGTVIHAVKSNRGLGNHIVVDHGNGLTSVYAHLYSIKAVLNQIVDANTVIGYEGSTGVSTGTHLHFEIRLNGQPVDPMKYIDGRP